MSNNNDSSQLVCLYARVSSELQQKEQTIESQIAELRNSITAAAQVLVEEYVDNGYSGELLERPALDQLRSDAAKCRWSKVYILAPDRLARKPHIAGLIIDELREKQIEVIFLNRPLGNTVEDQLLFGIQSLFAEYEKEKYKERQRRGKLFKARQGAIVGGKAPYGYRYVRDPGARAGRYVVDPTEAAVVRDVYAWYTSGNFYGFGSIVRELHRRGIVSPTGREIWRLATIRNILSDPAYTGTTYYNRRRRVPAKTSGTHYRRSKNTARVLRDKTEWIPIAVPSIVDQELQAKALAMMQRNRKLSPRHAKRQFLLKNLITCAECGCTYYAYSSGKNYYCYYQCSKFVKTFPFTTMHRPSFPRDLADSAIWEQLKAILTCPEVLAAAINEQIGSAVTAGRVLESELETTRLKVQRLTARRRRMLEAYDEHVISLGELKTQTSAYEKELAGLLERQTTLESQAAPGSQGITPEDARRMAQDYAERVSNADFESRRKLVTALVSNVEAHPDRLLVKCAIPALPGVTYGNGIVTTPFKWSDRNSDYSFRLAVPIQRIEGKLRATTAPAA